MENVLGQFINKVKKRFERVISSNTWEELRIQNLSLFGVSCLLLTNDNRNLQCLSRISNCPHNWIKNTLEGKYAKDALSYDLLKFN